MKHIRNINMGSTLNFASALTMAVALTLSFVSCSNESEPAINQGNAKEIPMTFEATYPGISSRATEEGFESNDKIGLYVAASDAPLEIGGNLVNNEPLTFDGTNWTATRTLYWDEGTYNAYAYYPYIKGISSIEDQPFSVSLDQSTAKTTEKLGGYEASDLLFAAKKGITASASPVNLTFKHIMSKLTIRLIKGEDFEGDMPTDATVYIHNTIPTATIDLQAGVATRNMKGNRQTIIAHHDFSTIYSAIIVPQRIENRMPLIEVEMKGVSYLFESKFQFKPGTEHLVNLIISDNPEKVKIDVGGEVQGWNESN